MFPVPTFAEQALSMSFMGERTGRTRSIAIIIAMLVVVAAAGGYIATQHGTSRAITVVVAVVLIAALAWLVLMIVSLFTVANVKRYDDGADTTLRNEQRPVPKRAPILADDEKPKTTGHRRKNPED